MASYWSRGVESNPAIQEQSRIPGSDQAGERHLRQVERHPLGSGSEHHRQGGPVLYPRAQGVSHEHPARHRVGRSRSIAGARSRLALHLHRVEFINRGLRSCRGVELRVRVPPPAFGPKLSLQQTPATGRTLCFIRARWSASGSAELCR